MFTYVRVSEFRRIEHFLQT